LNDGGIERKRTSCLRRRKYVPQQLDMLCQRPVLAFKQRHGEKEGSAGTNARI
jgi:hypothetical protein